MNNLDKLREMLINHPPGPINEKILNALCDAWNEIEGSNTTNLFSYKLIRAENPMWEPPNIIFVIERHGGAKFGSTRAERHSWNINIVTGTAYVAPAGYRPLHPQDKRLDTQAISTELCKILEQGKNDPRIEYRKEDKTEFKLIVADTITAQNKQTLTSRRKRFRTQFHKQLEEIGWEQTGRYIYRKKIE